MQSILKYLLAGLVSFVVCSLLTPILIRMAPKLGFLDQPDGRRLHLHPVPRCGGLAVFAGFHLACLLLFAMPWSDQLGGSLNFAWWQGFFLASSVLIIVGLFDDLKGLNWFYKLGGQIAAILVLFQLGIGMGQVHGVEIPVWLDLLLTMAWILVFVNAFNLIDGMDGLASGLACIAAFGLAATALIRQVPGDAVVFLALFAACAGFLRYNFHPARIFLGDSGSMFIGFTLAVGAMASSSRGTALATIGVPLLAIGVPIFDTMLAIWRRSVRSILNGTGKGFLKGVTHADLEHLHHRLIKGGLSQRRVALTLYALNLSLVALGLFSIIFSAEAVGIFIVAFVVGSYVVVRHLARVELWDSGTVLLRGLSRPQSPVLATVLYPALDFMALLSGLLLALFFSLESFDYNLFKMEFLRAIPIWAALPFLILVISGVYSRVWSQARISEFVLLVVTLFAASALSLGVSVIDGDNFNKAALLRFMIYFGTVGGLITGLRAFPRALQDLMQFIYQQRIAPSTDLKNILVGGADFEAQLYLRQHGHSQHDMQKHERIVGLVDDRPNLRMRKVFGYRVLGQFDEIPRLVDEHAVNEIVLTGDTPAEKKTRLIEFAKHNGLLLKEWKAAGHLLVAAASDKNTAPNSRVA